MANARLAYSNLLLASGVGITSSGDATGYPASNLADPARWKKWRSSTTTGDQSVVFDLGSALSFQLLALTDVQIHPGGTLKAQANATNVWTAPTVSDTISPLPSPDLTHVLADWLASVKSLRFIRFLFTNTGAVSSFVEIGAAFAGPYFESVSGNAQSIAPAPKVMRHDLSVTRQAVGGERSTVQRPKYHEVQGQWRLQSATDRDNLRAAFDANGSAIPCVLSLAPGTASLTYYGVFDVTFEVDHHVPSADLWDVPFRFLEDVA